MGSDLTQEVGVTSRLLAAAREREIPIIFTTIGFEPNLKDGSLWLEKAPGLGDLIVGGKWVKISAELRQISHHCSARLIPFTPRQDSKI